MARYKWDSPGDWLGDKINAEKAIVEEYILRGTTGGGSADAADAALANLCIITLWCTDNVILLPSEH